MLGLKLGHVNKRGPMSIYQYFLGLRRWDLAKTRDCPMTSEATVENDSNIMTSSNRNIFHWPFVRGIHQWSLDSPHKGKWRRALMFSLMCTWTNGEANNGIAGDLRRHNVHVTLLTETVMIIMGCTIYEMRIVWRINYALVNDGTVLAAVLLVWGVNKFLDALQWRHNGRDVFSNHQHHHCLLNRLFGRRSKKTPKLRVIGLWGTGEFPAQMASNAENVSIWWRHHGVWLCLQETWQATQTIHVWFVEYNT